MIIERRAFLAGLGALIAAPSIVRISSIMPVKLMVPTPYFAMGDIITIDHIEAVNRLTGDPAGRLRQFVITATGPFREAAIYPPIIESGTYKTVVKRPSVLIPALVPRQPIEAVSVG